MNYKQFIVKQLSEKLQLTESQILIANPCRGGDFRIYVISNQEILAIGEFCVDIFIGKYTYNKQMLDKLIHAFVSSCVDFFEGKRDAMPCLLGNIERYSTMYANSEYQIYADIVKDYI